MVKKSTETKVIVEDIAESRKDRLVQGTYYILVPLFFLALACFSVYDSGYAGGALFGFIAGIRMPYYIAYSKKIVKALIGWDT